MLLKRLLLIDTNDPHPTHTHRQTHAHKVTFNTLYIWFVRLSSFFSLPLCSLLSSSHPEFCSSDPRGKLPLEVPSVTRGRMWLPAQDSRTRAGVRQLAQEERVRFLNPNQILCFEDSGYGDLLLFHYFFISDTLSLLIISFLSFCLFVISLFCL